MTQSRRIPIVNLARARAYKAMLTPEQAAKARDWYPCLNRKAQELSAETGYSTEQIAGVIALHSINTSWGTNWALAHATITLGKRRGLVGTVKVPARLKAILDDGQPVAECLTSRQKVRQFMAAILLQDGCPIDRWMYRAYGVPENRPERYYRACELATRFMARQDGITAYEEQSLVWCAINPRSDVAVWEQ